MNLKITEDKKIEIEMEEKLIETIGFFGDEIKVEVTPPAQYHLFYVNKDAELLDENKKYFFHSVTAKLLHIVKRGRTDLETLVCFLTMRVTKINVDNWKKIKRGLTYVKIQSIII